MGRLPLMPQLRDVVGVLREFEDKSSKEVVVEAGMLHSKHTEVLLSAEEAINHNAQLRTSQLSAVLDVVEIVVVLSIRPTTEVGINLREVGINLREVDGG